MGGKIVRVSANTDSKTTAMLRLPDIKAEERKKTEHANPTLSNVKTFGDALAVLERRINNAVKLRPGARRDNFDNIRRIKATWPGIEKMLLRDLNTDGILDWAKRLHERYSATSYNNTIGMFRRAIMVGTDKGVVSLIVVPTCKRGIPSGALRPGHSISIRLLFACLANHSFTSLTTGGERLPGCYPHYYPHLG